MGISIDELRRAPAVQIRNVNRDRWLRLKGNAPQAVFGSDASGRDALISKSPGGELGFLYDERGRMTIWRSGMSGFGGGSELDFAHRVIESMGKGSQFKVLSHADAAGLRDQAREMIRPG